jgi:hypothetical protein
LAKFTNLQAYSYWSATEYAPNLGAVTGLVWYFNFGNGNQDAGSKGNGFYALAVSPGDVGIAAVPEPETYAMMLAGLGLVGFATRCRKHV